MDELKDIYDRITYLRHKGMKMKDIAALVEFPPAVLSALYTTVIPAYTKNRAKGMAAAGALDGALVWVNNVSKRRLLASVAPMKATLMATDVEPGQVAGGRGEPLRGIAQPHHGQGCRGCGQPRRHVHELQRVFGFARNEG